MGLTIAERVNFRKQVKMFILLNPTAQKVEVVSHFVKEGFAKSTVYATVDRLNIDPSINSTNDKKRTGRPSKLTKRQIGNMKHTARNRLGVTQRKLARKFKVSQPTICRNLAKAGLKYRKRIKTPKYNEKQAQRSKDLSKKLTHMMDKERKFFIMDDEKYFEFTCHETPGNYGFYTDDITKCSDNVRFKAKEKFPHKILVWIAGSEKGLSEPLIKSSKSEAINQDVYRKECLEKKLLPFINKYHGNGNYIFWPDLATCHYSKANIQWMTENINFVPKNLNPPNVPQARPIEDFWGYLIQLVYEDGWQAKTERGLASRIKNKLKEIDASRVKSFFRGVRARLRNIGNNGVYSPYKN